jgi:hypothetical protein
MYVTVRWSGSSPVILAQEVVACSPPDEFLTPFTSPSVQGEYIAPSEAHDGYHVSALV